MPRLHRTWWLSYTRNGSNPPALIYFDFQPVGRCRAGIAITAGVPLGNFAEVAANVALAALFGLHESLDFVVAVPSTFFFARIFDFADKKGVQARVFFLPEQKAIRGECVAAGSARLLVILLDTLRQREVNHCAHGRFINAQAEGHGAHH